MLLAFLISTANISDDCLKHPKTVNCECNYLLLRWHTQPHRNSHTHSHTHSHTQPHTHTLSKKMHLRSIDHSYLNAAVTGCSDGQTQVELNHICLLCCLPKKMCVRLCKKQTHEMHLLIFLCSCC